MNLDIAATPEEFDSLFDFQMQFAKMILGDGLSQDLTPQFVVMTRSRDGSSGFEIYTLATSFNSLDDQRAVMQSAGRKYWGERDSHLPIAIALLSEAWHAKASSVPAGGRPEHSPDRQEVICVQAMTVGRAPIKRHASAPVTRIRGQIRMGEFQVTPDDARVELPLLLHFIRGFAAEAWPAFIARN